MDVLVVTGAFITGFFGGVSVSVLIRCPALCVVPSCVFASTLNVYQVAGFNEFAKVIPTTGHSLDTKEAAGTIEYLSSIIVEPSMTVNLYPIKSPFRSWWFACFSWLLHYTEWRNDHLISQEWLWRARITTDLDVFVRRHCFGE